MIVNDSLAHSSYWLCSLISECSQTSCFMLMDSLSSCHQTGQHALHFEHGDTEIQWYDVSCQVIDRLEISQCKRSSDPNSIEMSSYLLKLYWASHSQALSGWAQTDQLTLLGVLKEIQKHLWWDFSLQQKQFLISKIRSELLLQAHAEHRPSARHKELRGKQQFMPGAQ